MGITVSLGLLLAGNVILAAQQPAAQTSAPEELTRGPIHEAFGEPVIYNPQPGPIAPRKPPEPVDEMPSEQKPEGENVIWISGYWFWDDQRQDFIWVSGFWRVAPPDRIWVPGYWAESGNRYQWISGFWSAASSNQAQYLPQPPDSLEEGPNIPSPGDDYIWAPGCWSWVNNRYFWQPGYWTQAYPDWIWTPAHYIWTPSGYLFAGGYWDYSINRRGLLFAPVYFPQGYLASRTNYVYTPSVVLSTAALATSLFVRPSYQHYYFGDYYGAENLDSGFYPAFAYHNSHYGYDPLFAHTAWQDGRQDKNWMTDVRNQYWNRREHIEARPPRTFADVQRAARQPNATAPIAHSLADVVKTKNNAFTFQKLEAQRLKEYAQHANQARSVIQERARFEQNNAVRASTRVEPKLPPNKPAAAPELRAHATWEMPRPKSTIPAQRVRAQLPPTAPKTPPHRIEAPKVSHPLPHPQEILKRPAARPAPHRKK